MTVDRVLYHTPGSCSRVALNALEETGLPYREQTVALMRGAHYEPDYLAINPKAKVPTLVEDGVVTTELPVILYRLATAHPEIGLLPLDAKGDVRLDSLSDVVWIADALHPTAGRIFRPAALSAVDADAIKSAAIEQLAKHATAIAARIGDDWWYGDRWSITDMFIGWVFTLAERYGFPLDDHPQIAAHLARTQARPSFIRARAIEQAVAVRDDITMPPGFAL